MRENELREKKEREENKGKRIKKEQWLTSMFYLHSGQPYLAPISYPQPSVYSYPYPTATPTQPLAHAPNTDPAVAAYHQYYHDLVVRYAQQQQQQLAAAAAAPQNALAAPVVPAVADNNNPVALAERHARRRSALSLAIKLIFMLFVLGRGASFERVVVLHIIAIVIFFYRTGRLRFVVRRANLGGAREENGEYSSFLGFLG